MRIRMRRAVAAMLPLLILSGCWDSRELTERAIWVATGWDAGENGKIRVSGQIIVPARIQTNVGGAPQGGSGGGAGGRGEDESAQKGYFSIVKEGNSIGEALQRMQSEISREIFFGHRRVILVGEEFARKGLRNKFDLDVRSPRMSIRTDIFVVRGGTAEDGLNVQSVLEPISATAIIKNHRQIGGRGDSAYLDFLIAANSDGIRPTMPAVEIHRPDYAFGHKKLRMAGLAIFDADLKLRGFLNVDEDRDYLWITGNLTKQTVSMVKNGGGVSMNLVHLRSRIVPEIAGGNKMRFKVKLRANAQLQENNSGISTANRTDLKKLEREFERLLERRLLATIRKVQRKYGIDIFGFGEAVRRRKPQRWNALKKDWDRRFAEAEISVSVDLFIQQEGLSEFPAIYRKGGQSS